MNLTVYIWYKTISIHAPRVGSDTCRWHSSSAAANFNPRSPCGERLVVLYLFHRPLNFNPRSPCGERRKRKTEAFHEKLISIHAPRVGSDDNQGIYHRAQAISIHAPRVGSDFVPNRLVWQHWISIHAPRVGSDRGKGLG